MYQKNEVHIVIQRYFQTDVFPLFLFGPES